MIDTLLKGAFDAILRIAQNRELDAQKREAQQLADLQQFYEDGAANTAALAKAFTETSAEAHTAFAEARARITRDAAAPVVALEP